ncbi:MAG: peroxiredoxin [Erythrobacter sp.]|jgi:peroxiredoxin (alkyl hydroperoxide reductase subunit C)
MDGNRGGVLRIGTSAPNFTARSTAGQLVLSDLRGSWVLLASHPGDFTPVCTSEFVALARHQAEFERLGCQILALSVDSLFAHLAWIRLIKQATGAEVRFPIIEDPTLEIARAYGMVDSEAHDASSVRASFFIDPAGVIRLITYYPATVGRSVDEMLRTLAALQTTDREGRLCPSDWRPGDATMPQPALDGSDVLRAGLTDWFYAKD